MSLSERVNKASGVDQQNQLSQERAAYEHLRNQVRLMLTADEIALFLATSTTRARSEIRSACLKAFEDPFWNDFDQAFRDRLVEEIIDGVLGFGPLEGMLSDPTITEIMVNGTHSIYFERDGKLYPSPISFSSDDQVRALIDRILGPLGRRIDESSPMVNARLPQGHRVNAVIAPLSMIGPLITIRKFSDRVLTLTDLSERGSFDSQVQRFLEWAVLTRKNIAVSGGTGSGKTTLLNALSCVIPASERVITIEDSAELRFLEHPHVVPLEARPRNAEGKGEITIRDLVINALRMRPDRIVVGECRGAEALDMLQAMNTGHDGSLTTLHANSPVEALSRLTTMVRYAADLPTDVIESYIASAIDIVIQTNRALDGSRSINEIVLFTWDRQERRCVAETVYRKALLANNSAWYAVPAWIDELPMLGLASRKEVETWKQTISLHS